METNFAIVLLTRGIFGGAERRFTVLYDHLSKNTSVNISYIISYELFEKIKNIYPEYPLDNVFPVGEKQGSVMPKESLAASELKNRNNDPSFPRKIYRHFKNYLYQKKVFFEIEAIRKEKKIKVFLGVFNGVLPLTFYLKHRNKRAGVIFCDMDSWFSNISETPPKWYLKYSTFNYALENADYVDFLSPFILNGVRDKGVNVAEGRAKITACSFTDYSKCRIGEKDKFRIAFAGRLEKDKNPLLFLDAAIIVAGKYAEAEIHIMGEGRLSYVIAEKIRSVTLPNIVFHGFHANPPDIFANCSVFVSIQTTNNYPSQSVLEAMACGNAIVATDVGDTRMFVNEMNGTLIPLEISALTKALIEYIEAPQIAKNKGDFAAISVRKNFTIEKASDYYLSLFNITAQKVTCK